MEIKFLDGTKKEFDRLQGADLRGADLRGAEHAARECLNSTCKATGRKVALAQIWKAYFEYIGAPQRERKT